MQLQQKDNSETRESWFFSMGVDADMHVVLLFEDGDQIEVNGPFPKPQTL